jgi:hypothetical protein
MPALGIGFGSHTFMTRSTHSIGVALSDDIGSSQRA